MPLVKKTLADPKPEAKGGLPALTAGLQSAKPEERWEAARQLAAFPESLSALAALLETETDARVRDAALTSLAKSNSNASFETILRYLRVDDAALRTAALDALKLMPEWVAARLDALLADADIDIRVLACDLARVAPPATSQNALAAVLRTDQSINVCAAAVDLLAEIGTPEILPALAACARRLPDPFLGFSIEMATTQIYARSAPPNARSAPPNARSAPPKA
jgi:HEAT repeat protein